MLLSSCLFPCLLLILSAPIGVLHAQTTTKAHNITVGSSLATTGTTTSWLSPSGEFAFGFRALEGNSSEFLLAVWFVNTDDKTTAWYANGDNPAPTGSTLQFTSYGFSLKDPTGQDLWSANVNDASYAAMLDTGNFAMYSSTGTVIWESFDNPSDTMLPSQVLQLNTGFRSRLMATDYSSGRFELNVQTDGNLVFYFVALVSGTIYSPYWASNTVGNGTRLVYNGTGDINLILKNGSLLVSSVQLDAPSDFYQRATLDYDGVFRQYVHPKGSSTRAKGGWSNGWTVANVLPQNICDNGGTKVGSGLCGFNSYCTSNSNQTTVDCECPPHYSFIDPNRKYKGCMPDFPPQSCQIDESDQFVFVTINNLDFPDADYEQYSTDLDTCRQQCLTDCFCSAAVFNDGTCWKKKIPLSNGQMGGFVDRTVLLKVPKNNGTQYQAHENDKWKKGKKVWILAGSILLGSSVFANVLLISALILGTHCYRNRSSKKTSSVQQTASLGQGLRAFTYKELESATNEFSEEVGHGGSGTVYKGYLHRHEHDAMFIAVKKLDSHVLADSEKEFITEMQTIGQTFHRNLVRLLGFCDEGPQRLLVFEFMNNGSLFDWLLNNNNTAKPSWNQRVQVALGIARGLLYLHEECSTQIIHCDMKPQNVLLDDNLTPKISDFGMAKLLKTDQTRTNTGIRGTKGYVAPEWFKNAGITSKVDVYSFGIILLELVCCRKNVEQDIEDEERIVLAYWVNDCFRDGRLDVVVPDWDQEATYDMRRIERFVKIALWCIQEEPSLRPTMLKVTQMLDGAVDIAIPPDPSSYISTIQ